MVEESQRRVRCFESTTEKTTMAAAAARLWWLASAAPRGGRLQQHRRLSQAAPTAGVRQLAPWVTRVLGDNPGPTTLDGTRHPASYRPLKRALTLARRSSTPGAKHQRDLHLPSGARQGQGAHRHSDRRARVRPAAAGRHGRHRHRAHCRHLSHPLAPRPHRRCGICQGLAYQAIH